MADDITYPTPIGERVYPGSTHLKPDDFRMCVSEEVVSCVFVGDNGIRYQALWEGQVALDIITQINTLNFTNNSFKKRITQRALDDGKIPAGGTVS